MIRPDSITQFKAYIDETLPALVASYQSQEGIKEAQQAIQAAERIFFNGSGSSVPAALLGQQLLARYTQKAGIFASSSLLLDDLHLTDKDVVVLVSQGWNRADAALITRKVLVSPAKLIVITGRPDRQELYDIVDKAKLAVVTIYPDKEKIFCRPASAITAYIKMTQLLAPITKRQFSAQAWLDAYTEGATYPVTSLKHGTRHIVLASSLLLCSGNNIALSLREGAGHYGTLQEVEAYGHGQYVPDQVHRNQVYYVVLRCGSSSYTYKAFRRIEPMLKSTRSHYEIWQSELHPMLANVSFMAHTAQLIYQDILRTNWDMNNPPGMEGNRMFHEVEEL